jgi:hypothetical protein
VKPAARMKNRVVGPLFIVAAAAVFGLFTGPTATLRAPPTR